MHVTDTDSSWLPYERKISMADLSSKQGFYFFFGFSLFGFSPFSNLTPEVAGYWSTRQIGHLDWLFIVTTATPLQSFLKVFGNPKIICVGKHWNSRYTCKLAGLQHLLWHLRTVLPPCLPFFLFIWPILQMNSGIMNHCCGWKTLNLW